MQRRNNNAENLHIHICRKPSD